MPDLNGKTVFISGGSRGIGAGIVRAFAAEGAQVAYSGTRLDKESEGEGFVAELTDPHAPVKLMEAVIKRFGGIDILVNNASAISLTGTAATSMKRFDLMFGVNVRGTFACTQACLPHLRKSAAAGRNPHILTLSPPLNLDPKWFKDHVAYTMAKYGMSMCVLGMAEEFRADGIGVNALWPRSVIATAAIAMIPGAADELDRMRRPEVMADAAHAVLLRNARTTTGRFFIDEDVLAAAGITDLERYAVKPGTPLLPDLFLD